MKSLEGTERTVGGMSEPREGIIFYRSFYESIRELPPENAVNVYNAVFQYGFYGEQNKLSGIEKAIFTIIKPQLDANQRKYESGKKGGRPAKKKTDGEDEGETKAKPNNNQAETKTKAKENVKEKENEKKKETETNNDKDTDTDTFNDNALISFHSKDRKAFHLTKEDIASFPIINPGANILGLLEMVKDKWDYSIPENYSKSDVLESLKKRVSAMQEEQERKKQSGNAGRPTGARMILPDDFDEGEMLPYS